MGGYDQVGRVLKRLTEQGTIIRIGYEKKKKTKISSLTGEVVPTAPLPTLGMKALSRLKVKTMPTSGERAYREGRSTQIPTGRMIGVKGRISRKIGYKGAYIAYERVS